MQVLRDTDTTKNVEARVTETNNGPMPLTPLYQRIIIPIDPNTAPRLQLEVRSCRVQETGPRLIGLGLVIQRPISEPSLRLSVSKLLR